MMFNATFSNILVIVAVSFIGTQCTTRTPLLKTGAISRDTGNNGQKSDRIETSRKQHEPHHKSGGESLCSRKVNSSCFLLDTRHATKIVRKIIVGDRGRTTST
jgi:hypothetical protein